MRLGKYKKLLSALAITAAIYVVMVLALQSVGLENAKGFIIGTGWRAPILYTVLCAISLIVAPLSGSSLFVMGGALFGKDMAWVLSWLASIVGCSVNFWISRKFGRKVVARFVGQRNLDELDRFTLRFQGQKAIVGMILLMPISQDIISYAIGLTRISYLRFFVALVISSAAIVAAYVYIGTSLLEVIIQ